jgi:hypothetical protein
MREPLLHFLLGGAGLFLLFSYVSDPLTGGDDQIVVTSGQIEHFVTLFVKTRQRTPTDVELRGLVDNHVLEEVLYREALAMGLDKDDSIVRRRLRQKIEFLLDDFTLVEPADEDLQQFLDKDPDRFRLDARISFTQVYLQEESRASADATLATLQSGISDPSQLSDSHLIAYQFDDISEAVISAQFGGTFTTALFELDIGEWTGPIDSPFGLHLVRIEQIVPGVVPALAEIRAEVEREWLVDFRASAQQAIVDQMKLKYTVTVEPYAAAER